MDLHLDGKTAIVTGGGSNIGRAVVHRFAEEKAKIVIAEYDEKQGKAVEAELKAKGADVLLVNTDVTDNDQVVAMVKKANDTFGPIDILVNNVAGFGGNYHDQLFIEEVREKWEGTIACTYMSVINCTRAVLDQMIEQKSGSIVNLGSDAGRMGEYREAVYSGAKGAVISFTKAIAREVGKFGIRLNVVCPGLTVPASEEMIGDKSAWAGGMIKIFDEAGRAKAAKSYPLRKLGKADDLADAIVFIASDCAGHITGQTLSVSGGYSMMS